MNYSDSFEKGLKNIKKNPFSFEGSHSLGERMMMVYHTFLTHGMKGFYWISYFYPFSIRTKLFTGNKFTIGLPQGISLALFGVFGQNEAPLTRFFMKNFKADSVFYDVGAHFGYYSSLADGIVKEVYSFEPNPETFKLLNQNTKGTKNEATVSDIGGTKTFYADTKKLSAGSSFFERSGFTPVNVKTLTLDQYVQSHNIPTIIKIDVEEAEADVISGAKEMLTRHSPLVAIEVSENSKAPAMLKSLGYKSFKIEENGDISAINEISGSDNFVFKKS